MRKIILSFVFILISIVLISAQATTCPVEFEPALARASALCVGTGRNQVCYGNNLVNMIPQATNLSYTFNMPGDITDVNNVQALSLSALDETSGNWGIALMRLLANLDPSNSEDVTILLFGDVDIDNAVPYKDYPEIVANSYVNMRRYPKADATVVQSVAPGDGLLAIGKLADDLWIQVVNPSSNYVGWIFASLVDNVDLASLDIVDPSVPYFGPMQAFYYTGGTARYDCTSVPGDGMLIQTPEGLRRVTLWINEVTIEFLPGSGTTTLVQTEADNSVSLNMLEGSAFVQNGQNGYVVVPGSKVTVHKNSDNTVAVSSPVPYDSSLASNAPVQSLARPIQAVPPADKSSIILVNSTTVHSNSTSVGDANNSNSGTSTSTTQTNASNGGSDNSGSNSDTSTTTTTDTSTDGTNKFGCDGKGNSCNAPGKNKNKS